MEINDSSSCHLAGNKTSKYLLCLLKLHRWHKRTYMNQTTIIIALLAFFPRVSKCRVKEKVQLGLSKNVITSPWRHSCIGACVCSKTRFESDYAAHLLWWKSPYIPLASRLTPGQSRSASEQTLWSVFSAVFSKLWKGLVLTHGITPHIHNVWSSLLSGKFCQLYKLSSKAAWQRKHKHIQRHLSSTPRQWIQRFLLHSGGKKER